MNLDRAFLMAIILRLTEIDYLLKNGIGAPFRVTAVMAATLLVVTILWEKAYGKDS